MTYVTARHSRCAPDSAVFHGMWNRAFSETEQLGTLARNLEQHLPASWRVRRVCQERGRPAVADGLLTVRGPDGMVANVAIEVKSRLDTTDVPRVADQLHRLNTTD